MLRFLGCENHGGLESDDVVCWRSLHSAIRRGIRTARLEYPHQCLYMYHRVEKQLPELAFISM